MGGQCQDWDGQCEGDPEPAPKIRHHVCVVCMVARCVSGASGLSRLVVTNGVTTVEMGRLVMRVFHVGPQRGRCSTACGSAQSLCSDPLRSLLKHVYTHKYCTRL